MLYRASRYAALVVVLSSFLPARASGLAHENGIGSEFQAQETAVHEATGNRAVIAVKGGKYYVLFEGLAEGPYDYVRMLSFSRDGGAITYSAAEDGKEYCIADGRRSGPYSSVCSPTFSDDGRFIAFEASQDGKYFVAYGHAESPGALHESPRYDMSTMKPEFSRDGSRLFFVLSDYRESRMLRFIADTETGNSNAVAHDSIGRFVKSPDGTRYAYVAGDGGFYFVVSGTFAGFGRDEREGPRYDLASELTISPDGKYLAYVCGWEGSQFLAVTDFTMTRSEEGPLYEAVRSPEFSGDGKHVEYSCRRGPDACRGSLPVPAPE